MDHAFNLYVSCLTQLVFMSALVFMICYTALHPWWQTLHGRTLALLAIGAMGYTGRSVLFMWHVVHSSPLLNAVEHGHPDAWSWVAIQFHLILPVVFLVMTWTVLRRWLRQRVSPAPDVHRVHRRAHH